MKFPFLQSNCLDLQKRQKIVKNVYIFYWIEKYGECCHLLVFICEHKSLRKTLLENMEICRDRSSYLNIGCHCKIYYEISRWLKIFSFESLLCFLLSQALSFMCPIFSILLFERVGVQSGEEANKSIVLSAWTRFSDNNVLLIHCHTQSQPHIKCSQCQYSMFDSTKQHAAM